MCEQKKEDIPQKKLDLPAGAQEPPERAQVEGLEEQVKRIALEEIVELGELAPKIEAGIKRSQAENAERNKENALILWYQDTLKDAFSRATYPRNPMEWSEPGLHFHFGRGDRRVGDGAQQRRRRVACRGSLSGCRR